MTKEKIYIGREMYILYNLKQENKIEKDWKEICKMFTVVVMIYEVIFKTWYLVLFSGQTEGGKGGGKEGGSDFVEGSSSK